MKPFKTQDLLWSVPSLWLGSCSTYILGFSRSCIQEAARKHAEELFGMHSTAWNAFLWLELSRCRNSDRWSSRRVSFFVKCPGEVEDGAGSCRSWSRQNPKSLRFFFFAPNLGPSLLRPRRIAAIQSCSTWFVRHAAWHRISSSSLLTMQCFAFRIFLARIGLVIEKAADLRYVRYVIGI